MPLLGEFAALLTAFLWSGTSIVFTEATIRVGSIMVNITRMIIALFLLLLSIILMQLDISMSVSQILNLSWSGILGLVLGDTFLFRAFKDIGARISMLLMALVPAITAVLAWVVLDEQLAVLGISGMLITMLGIAIVILERKAKGSMRASIPFKGVMWGVLGAIGQAAGLILAKFAFNEAPIHGMVATTVRVAAAIIVFLPVALFLNWYRNPVSVFLRERKAFVFTSIGAVIGPYLGITFSLVAIAHTEVAIATTIMALPPIIMLPMLKLIYKEELSARSYVGAFLAVGGVALLFLR